MRVFNGYFSFSWIYYSPLSGTHFYHSTSQYEYEFFSTDASEILQDIKTEIIQGFLKHGKPNSEFNGWQMDINELDVYSLNVKNFPIEFGFTVRVPIIHIVQGQADAWTSLRSDLIVFLQNKIMTGGKIYLLLQFDKSSSSSFEGTPSPNILFPNSISGYSGTPTLSLPLSLYNRIIAFGQGYRGFPSGVSGQYLRMLYFSFGVATSSAFGDIVPLSTQARFFVSAEALLAIIFISLFLSGLAYDVGEALKTTHKIE